MGYTGRGSGNKPYDVYDKAEVDAKTSASSILANIKIVDGVGSGLDADTVDGVEGALLGVG